MTRACIYMTAILVTFLLAGHLVIVAFGISVPGIRIAGGLVIGLLGFRMLFPDEGQIIGEGRRSKRVKESLHEYNENASETFLLCSHCTLFVPRRSGVRCPRAWFWTRRDHR